jgi:hypothetical protein
VADGYFGSAALALFYNQADQTLRNITLTIRGQSGAYGITDRFIKGVKFVDSTLSGGKNAPVAELAKKAGESGPVSFVDSVVKNFKK